MFRPITYIYALVDPRTQIVRYIGKSDRPKRRLSSHLSKQGLADKTYRAYWLRSLVSSGFKPEMICLQAVSLKDWEGAEKYWIHYYKEQGVRLTNSKDGGDGGANPCEASRRRMACAAANRWESMSEEDRRSFTKSRAEACLGKVISPEVRAKISAAQKGRTTPTHQVRKLSEAHKRFWQSQPIEARTQRRARLVAGFSAERNQKIGDAHRGKSRGGASPYVGVSFFKRDQKWRAYIVETFPVRKQIHLGYFTTQEEAARAYNEAAKLYHGEFACLNDLDSFTMP